MLIIMDG